MDVDLSKANMDNGSIGHTAEVQISLGCSRAISYQLHLYPALQAGKIKFMQGVTNILRAPSIMSRLAKLHAFV